MINDNIRIATLDRLCGQMRGLQATATNLANRHSRHAVRQASADQGLPGRVLADPGGKHLPHDHLGNLIRLNTGAGQQRFDDLGTELGRRHLANGAVEFTDRGAQRCRDNYLVHVLLNSVRIFVF